VAIRIEETRPFSRGTEISLKKVAKKVITIKKRSTFPRLFSPSFGRIYPDLKERAIMYAEQTTGIMNRRSRRVARVKTHCPV
jgi:hypothetical protein